MGAVLGLEAKLYRNTGSHSSPVWNEVPNVKDLTLNVEKSEADVSRRASRWKERRAALKDASIEYEMIWDPGDADFVAIKDSFFDDTSIEMAAMDGDIAVAGTQGLRATMDVFTFTRSEPLEEALTVKITQKPSYATVHPQWYEVGQGSS